MLACAVTQVLTTFAFSCSKNADIPSPLGYNPSALVNQSEVVRDQRLVIKKSWDLALGPLKNVSSSPLERPVLNLWIPSDSHESIHHVHVRKLDFHFSHHDGRHDADPAYQGHLHHPGDFQNGGGGPGNWPAHRLLPGQPSKRGFGPLQVPQHGAPTHPRLRLVGICPASDTARILRRRNFVCLVLHI